MKFLIYSEKDKEYIETNITSLSLILENYESLFNAGLFETSLKRLKDYTKNSETDDVSLLLSSYLKLEFKGIYEAHSAIQEIEIVLNTIER